MSYNENGAEKQTLGINLRRPDRLGYRISELADATGMSDWFIRREIQHGNIRAKKIGSALVILAEDAMAWLSNQPDAPHETNGTK